MSTLFPDLASFKKEFDPLLERELDRYIAKQAEYSTDSSIHDLLLHGKKIALAGGKRVRPYMAFLMYQSVGGDKAGILPLLVGIELFHVFALIHDDIIDSAKTRHGVTALNCFAISHEEESGIYGVARAEAQALLVGDLVYVWSRQTLTREAPDGLLREILTLFDSMAYGVVVGQMLDVKLLGAITVREEDVIEKTILKTAQYTFTYPMLLGALVANRAHDKGWIEKIGMHLGFAFQIQDDLLDIIGSHTETGKQSFQDVAEAQHTLFTLHVQKEGTEEDKKLLAALMGKGCKGDECTALRMLFEKSGAIAAGTKEMQASFSAARALLVDSPFSEEAKIAWERFILQMEKRTA
jgi:geranylgeranyl diphosphate synthase type I